MPDSTLFLAAGDLHAGDTPEHRLAMVFEAATDWPDARFLAVPGDLTQNGRPDEYAVLAPFLRRLPFPFHGVLGNHDVLTGPDADARTRFCRALGVEAPTYCREYNGLPYAFISADGNADGARIEIQRSLCALESLIVDGEGPVFLFCHAPLTGTVDAAPGRPCFVSDHPDFGLPASDAVRRLVRRVGRTVVWVCGHTHSPLRSDGLFCTERLGSATLHSVNLSSPAFTGRDIRRDDVAPLYRFELGENHVTVTIRDLERGTDIRTERLAL